MCRLEGDFSRSDLVDGIFPDFDVNSMQSNSWAIDFFTVNRSKSETVEIGFLLPAQVEVMRIKVDFLNCPNRAVGIKDVTLYGIQTEDFPVFEIGTAVHLWNSSTHTSDPTVCKAMNKQTLIQQTHSHYQCFFLVFSFDANIEWLFLSEVSFFASDGPTLIVPLPTMLSTGIPTPTVSPHATFSTGLNTSPLTPNDESTQDSYFLPLTIIIIIGAVLAVLCIVLAIGIIICFCCIAAKSSRRRAKSTRAEATNNVCDDIDSLQNEKDEVVNPVYERIGKEERKKVEFTQHNSS